MLVHDWLIHDWLSDDWMIHRNNFHRSNYLNPWSHQREHWQWNQRPGINWRSKRKASRPTNILLVHWSNLIPSLRLNCWVLHVWSLQRVSIKMAHVVGNFYPNVFDGKIFYLNDMSAITLCFELNKTATVSDDDIINLPIWLEESPDVICSQFGFLAFV